MKNKGLQICKPGSVNRQRRSPAIYLVPASQPGSIGPPAWISQSEKCGQHISRNGESRLLGLSIYKVCPLRTLPHEAVRSYRTFSPLPALGLAKALAVILCGTGFPINTGTTR